MRSAFGTRIRKGRASGGRSIVATMRRLCQSCPESRLVCKISLDGPPDYHDKMRVVKGCYDKAMKTYHGLVPLLEEFENFDLGVNTVLCAENQDLVDGFIDTIAETMPKITTHTVSSSHARALRRHRCRWSQLRRDQGPQLRHRRRI